MADRKEGLPSIVIIWLLISAFFLGRGSTLIRPVGKLLSTHSEGVRPHG